MAKITSFSGAHSISWLSRMSWVNDLQSVIASWCWRSFVVLVSRLSSRFLAEPPLRIFFLRKQIVGFVCAWSYLLLAKARLIYITTLRLWHFKSRLSLSNLFDERGIGTRSRYQFTFLIFVKLSCLHSKSLITKSLYLRILMVVVLWFVILVSSRSRTITHVLN